MKVWEAAVVGGGLAGGAVAIHLARSGRSVILLEKEGAPHHKVCGEFLSGESVPLLEELGVDVDALGATKISNWTLRSRSSVLKTALPFTARGISRKKLDEEVLQRAQSFGVELNYGCRVSSLRKQSQEFRLETSKGEVYARDVFWATGKHDVARVLKRQGRENHHVAFKRHLKLPEKIYRELDGKIELHLFSGGYGGLSQIEDGLLNFCFILEKERLPSSRWEEVLEKISRGNSRLKEIFDVAEWQWARPLAISAIPYGHILSEQRDFFVLGDQMSVIPSLAGDGMAMALLSAKKAAYHYSRVKSSGGDSSTGVESYHSEMRSLFAAPVNLGYRLQSLFRHRLTTEIVMKAVAPFPKLTETLIRKTRCSPVGGEPYAH